MSKRFTALVALAVVISIVTPTAANAVNLEDRVKWSQVSSGFTPAPSLPFLMEKSKAVNVVNKAGFEVVLKYTKGQKDTVISSGVKPGSLCRTVKGVKLYRRGSKFVITLGNGTWPNGFSNKKDSDDFWKPYVRWALKKRGAYNSTNLKRELNVIYYESHGNYAAKNKKSSATGLGQFLSGWVDKKGSSFYVTPSKRRTSKDWRMNPVASIDRMALAAKQTGGKSWKKHWSKTAFR